MKSLIISLVLVICSMFILSPAVSAENIFAVCGSGTAAPNTTVCKAVGQQHSSGTNPILNVLKTVISILGVVIGIASVLVIMAAGLTFIINGSDPQAVERARNMILYAVIGIIIAVLSESIVVFILKTVQ